MARSTHNVAEQHTQTETPVRRKPVWWKDGEVETNRSYDQRQTFDLGAPLVMLSSLADIIEEQ